MKTVSLITATAYAVNLKSLGLPCPESVFDHNCHCFEDDCYPQLVLSDCLQPYHLLALDADQCEDWFECGHCDTCIDDTCIPPQGCVIENPLKLAFDKHSCESHDLPCDECDENNCNLGCETTVITCGDGLPGAHVTNKCEHFLCGGSTCGCSGKVAKVYEEKAKQFQFDDVKPIVKQNYQEKDEETGSKPPQRREVVVPDLVSDSVFEDLAERVGDKSG